MKIPMTEQIQQARQEYDDWVKKNKLLLKLLGFSWQTAAFEKNNIEHIVEDLKSYIKRVERFIFFGLIILIVL